MAVRRHTTDIESTVAKVGGQCLIEGRPQCRAPLALEGKREIEILLDQRLFELDADTFDTFATTLDSPSPAGPALKALMKRRPSWEK
jgi:hypothetical protein